MEKSSEFIKLLKLLEEEFECSLSTSNEATENLIAFFNLLHEIHKGASNEK